DSFIDRRDEKDEPMRRLQPNCTRSHTERLPTPRHSVGRRGGIAMNDEDRVHRFRATCRWNGSTGVGYDSYVRAHEVLCPPAEDAIQLSADPAFLGNSSLLNPEQLVVAAASSCQLLSFLAVAARARVDVVSYVDDAEAEMPERASEMSIERIVLRPHIVVRPGASIS